MSINELVSAASMHKQHQRIGRISSISASAEAEHQGHIIISAVHQLYQCRRLWKGPKADPDSVAQQQHKKTVKKQRKL